MLTGIIKHALMITSFVFIMMLLIEYINVMKKGIWQNNLKKAAVNTVSQFHRSGWTRYVPCWRFPGTGLFGLN